MSNKKVNLRAFTLLEITVAMLLVALLSGFAYYALHTFANLSQYQQTKKRDKYSLELLLSRIEADWYLADSLAYRDNEMLFKDTIGIIQYTFEDSLILRNQYQLRTDSFMMTMNVSAIQNLHKDDFETSYLQYFKGTIFYEGKGFPIELQKEYAADQIIQHDLDRNYDTD